MGPREKRWIDSDLVGIPATLYGFGVLLVSLALVRYASLAAGVVIAVGFWVPMVIFAIRERGLPAAPLDINQGTDGTLHRVLVIGNKGLEDPALCDEICHVRGRDATEAMIFAPVVASSRLHDLANDVDGELDLAERRLDAALRSLHEAGVRASGRTDIAEPMESLLDGLREFPANEIVVMPDHDGDWDAAAALARRARSEAGLSVNEVARA